MKMTPAVNEMVSIQVEDQVTAFDGGNKDMRSPNQSAFDAVNYQIAPPVYNIQTTTISGVQKFMIYAAFAGIAFIIYKKYLK